MARCSRWDKEAISHPYLPMDKLQTHPFPFTKFCCQISFRTQRKEGGRFKNLSTHQSKSFEDPHTSKTHTSRHIAYSCCCSLALWKVNLIEWVKSYAYFRITWYTRNKSHGTTPLDKEQQATESFWEYKKESSLGKKRPWLVILFQVVSPVIIHIQATLNELSSPCMCVCVYEYM